MNEQEREQIKAELRAEMQAEQRDNAWAAGLSKQRASASKVGNTTGVVENYGDAPIDSAQILGSVLAGQMIAGMLGEGLTDDGHGEATGHRDA